MLIHIYVCEKKSSILPLFSRIPTITSSPQPPTISHGYENNNWLPSVPRFPAILPPVLQTFFH